MVNANYLLGWENKDDVLIPPVIEQGFKEKVIIRKKVSPIVYRAAAEDDNSTISIYDLINNETATPLQENDEEEKTVLLQPDAKQEEDPDDDKTVLLDDFKPEPQIYEFVKRMKTDQVVSVEGDSFVIGKGGDVDFQISDNPAISRRHAEIFKKGEQFYLKDLGSSNHSWIGEDMLLEPVELTDQTVFRLANEEFEFIISEQYRV